jgi:hypothetical protein
LQQAGLCLYKQHAAHFCESPHYLLHAPVHLDPADSECSVTAVLMCTACVEPVE